MTTTTIIIIYKSLVLDYSWVSNRLNWDRMKIISNQDAELNFFFRFGDHWLGCYPPSALSYKATSSSWTYYCRWPELAMQLTLKKNNNLKNKKQKKSTHWHNYNTKLEKAVNIYIHISQSWNRHIPLFPFKSLSAHFTENPKCPPYREHKIAVVRKLLILQSINKWQPVAGSMAIKLNIRFGPGGYMNMTFITGNPQHFHAFVFFSQQQCI